MKKLYLLLVLATFFTSCINKKDYSSVGTNALDLIMAKDTTELKKYFTRDTSFTGEIEEYIKLYSGKDYKLLDIDTSSIDSNKYLDVYYKIDTSFHRFEANYKLNKNGELKFDYIWINDLSKECSEYLKSPSKPSSFALFYPEISWKSTGQTLNEVSIKIQNNYADYDIETLKFKLQIFVNKDLVVNRTIICNEKIYAGDFIDYKIGEISNLFIGHKITRENLTFEALSIESLPREKIYVCEELMKIKKSQLAQK